MLGVLLGQNGIETCYDHGVKIETKGNTMQ